MKTARALVLAAVTAAFVMPPSVADAVPQWRLRRWLTYRAPIDPTIRTNVRFGRSSGYATRSSGRGVVRSGVSRYR